MSLQMRAGQCIMRTFQLQYARLRWTLGEIRACMGTSCAPNYYSARLIRKMEKQGQKIFYNYHNKGEELEKRCNHGQRTLVSRYSTFISVARERTLSHTRLANSYNSFARADRNKCRSAGSFSLRIYVDYGHTRCNQQLQLAAHPVRFDRFSSVEPCAERLPLYLCVLLCNVHVKHKFQSGN